VLDIKRKALSFFFSTIGTRHDHRSSCSVSKSKLIPNIWIIFSDICEANGCSFNILFDSFHKNCSGGILIYTIRLHSRILNGRFI